LRAFPDAQALPFTIRSHGGSYSQAGQRIVIGNQRLQHQSCGDRATSRPNPGCCRGHLCDAIASHHNCRADFGEEINQTPGLKNLAGDLEDVRAHLRHTGLAASRKDHEWNAVAAAYSNMLVWTSTISKTFAFNCREMMTAGEGRYYQRLRQPDQRVSMILPPSYWDR